MKKGILKFKSDLSKGAMHHIEYNGIKVSLTKKESRKVQHLEKGRNLLIAKNLLSRNFVETKIRMNDNSKYVNEVYDFMLTNKHTHYKDGYEGLVVLEFI
jgi:hypothetical protein